MKTPYLTLCAFVAFASLANAEPGQDTDAKRQAPQPPAASGTSNGGDVDKALPKTPADQTTSEHGTAKTPKSEASPSEKPKMPKDDGTNVAPVEPKDKTDKVTDTPDKVTTRDHGADKVITPSGKDTEDKSKDAKTEDKAKSDKISDRDHGAQKSKN